MHSTQSEKDKYTKAWNHDRYRAYSPGEQVVLNYVMNCDPHFGRIIDFGTGTGRAAYRLHKLNFDVTMIDIADNCLDDDVREALGNRLVLGSLWEPMDLPRAPEGFCTDVMEHIPPERVDDVLKNIMGLVDRCFFQICLKEDHFGTEIEEHLHLTVRPFVWWRDKLREYGNVLDARDLNINGWFYVES